MSIHEFYGFHEPLKGHYVLDPSALSDDKRLNFSPFDILERGSFSKEMPDKQMYTSKKRHQNGN